MACAWSVIRDIVRFLHPCRFSIFVVVAGGALLLVNAQGREVAMGLVDSHFFWTGIAFHFSVFLWAFESWYWARLMTDMVHGADRKMARDGTVYRRHEVFFKAHGPRIISAAAYMVAGIALFLASAWGHLALNLLAGSVFYWLLVKRLPAFDSMLRSSGFFAEMVRNNLGDFIGDPRDPVSSVCDLPLLSWLVLGLSIILAVLASFWIWIDAVSFGWAFGAAAVVFIGFALIVPGGSVLVYLSLSGDHRLRAHGTDAYPAVSLLLIWLLIVGPWVDNHEVRTTGDIPVDRETLSIAALKWHEQAVATSGVSDPPLVMVATAGGGIRAAYWTATVLGRLQDEEPRFRNLLFGISGVSGGSVGATVFTTLLADGTVGIDPSACGANGKAAIVRKSYECAGQEVLTRDFLAPSVAALLFPDLMQRIIPIIRFPDRAQALEEAWERAWGEAGLPGGSWTERTFSQIWTQSNSYLPALFLNGTHVESGKRIITSNLKIDGSAFIDSYDYYGLASGDLLPSTAAMNSARFAYVSPAGTLIRGGSAVGHIVDGGYFENFGAATAREVLTAVVGALESEGKHARPVLIQIVSDPNLGEDDLDERRALPPSDRDATRWANETLSPLRALLNARDARGVQAYKEFMRAAGDPNRRADFWLCGSDGGADPALGWVLASASRTRMQNMIRSDECGNQVEFAKVLKAIR